MGLEAIGGAIGRGASSVGCISAEAPAPVSALSSIGKLADFGPRLEGPLTPIVNEGPVGLMDLKNTMPLQIGQQNPITEINFQPQPKLNASDVVAEAESIFSQAQRPEINGIPFSSLREADEIGPKQSNLEIAALPLVARNDKLVEPVAAPTAAPKGLENPLPQLAVSPAVEPAIKVKSQTETKTSNEQEVAESVTEVITKEQIDIVEEERVKKREKKFVVDKFVLSRRVREVGPAVQKAEREAERLGYGKKIIGWILEKFIPLVHPGYMSKVVRPEGPDGTLSIIRGAIKAKDEFNSPQEVEAVIWDNRPISLEEEGEPVSDEEVRKVFQDRIVKPANKVTEIVERRMVKKVQKPVDQDLLSSFTAETSRPKLGLTLEDLNLAEVFKG